MSLPPAIRVNVQVPFPAQVTGSGFVQITKSQGVWNIGLNYLGVLPLPGIVPPTAVIGVFDQATGQFYYATYAQIIASATQVPVREITVAGPVAARNTDGDLLKSVAGALSVTLLPSALAPRPLGVKDVFGDASSNNITVYPSGSEKIDNNLTQFAITSDYGSATFYPRATGGYYVK